MAHFHSTRKSALSRVRGNKGLIHTVNKSIMLPSRTQTASFFGIFQAGSNPRQVTAQAADRRRQLRRNLGFRKIH